MERREFLKIGAGTLLAAGAGGFAIRYLAAKTGGHASDDIPDAKQRWGMLIDLTNCEEGCTECLEECRRENNVYASGDSRYDNHWIRKVKVRPTKPGEEHEEHEDGEVREVLLLCNHCDKPPCAQVCPVQATYRRDDGIVIVDHHRCIGCRYCMIACPYNARQFNFADQHEWTNKERPKRSHGVAESCTLCAHRLDHGEDPACVAACREKGCNVIKVGDLMDPDDEVSKLIAKSPVKRLREDLGTEPKLYYIGL